MKAIEKIEKLFDESTFVRTNAYMVSKNAEEAVYGDGVLTGYGLICGRPVYAAVVDSSVFFGALGAVSASKIANTVKAAEVAGAPFVFINESAGLRLEEGLEGLEGYGKVISALSNASGIIPLIGLVNGKLSGADAYMTAMCDFLFMTGKSQLSVTGNEVLNAVNNVAPATNNTDAKKNSEVSGNVEFVEEDEEKAIEKIKKLLFFLPDNSEDGVPAYVCNDDLNRYSEELCEIASGDVCDAREVLKEIADNKDILEVSEKYATTAITAFIMLNGKTVGAVANNAKVNDGKLNRDACRKIADFVSFCDEFNIPVLTLTDTTGFEADLDGEAHGVVKEAAKMADVFNFTSVPKVNIVLKNAFGGAFILMNSKSLGADMVYAWDNSTIAAVNPETAAVVLNGDQIKSAADPKAMRAQLAKEYKDSQANAVNAAALGYVDDIINPGETRARVISALEVLENKSARR